MVTDPDLEPMKAPRHDAGHRKPVLVVMSQVYVPDPASTGQHMADVTAEMVRRGFRVVVYTANRGYDDPTTRYPRREQIDGAEVVRLPFSSFGKSSVAVRLVGGLFFIIQAALRALFLSDLSGVLVSTTPPMAPLGAIIVSLLRRVPVTFWVMDLNPDQLVALGRIGPRALPVRIFDWLNWEILGRARAVVVLDRFMAARILAKRDVSDKLTILPPWPHEDHRKPVAREANPFRTAHGLDDRFVVMYSGNHGPSSPITTAVRAAVRLRDDPRIAFVFVGGGIDKREVDAVTGPTILSLPYQPLEELRWSLSAADVHLVTIGNDVVGIVHPCKVYGAMAVSRPVILLGPEESHIGDLLAEEQFGWRVAQGDVDALIALVLRLAGTDPGVLADAGERGRRLIATRLGKAVLCEAFCDLVAEGLPRP